jgi:hypothetical protein
MKQIHNIYVCGNIFIDASVIIPLSKTCRLQNIEILIIIFCLDFNFLIYLWLKQFMKTGSK